MDATLLVAARATGMAERDPAEALYLAVMTLRKRMEDGISIEDPRCVALLTFINCFRLNIVQKSNKRAEAGEARSKQDLIDEERDQLASLIGLSKADPLAKTFQSVQRRQLRRAPVSLAGYPKLSLQPKASRDSVVKLMSQVLHDRNLALRMDEDSVVRESGLTPKKREKRARAILENRVARGDDVLYINRFFSTSYIWKFRDPTGVLRISQDDSIPGVSNLQAQVAARDISELRNVARMQALHLKKRPPQEILGVDEATKRFMSSLKTAFGDFSDGSINDIRAILAEREGRIFRRIHIRKAVIAALPETLPSRVRKLASMEAKELDLIDLQRRVRARVSSEMKKMMSPIVHEGYVPPDTLSRLFRNRSKLNLAVVGAPMKNQDESHANSISSPNLTLEAASRAAQVDKERMTAQRSAERRDFLRGLMAHERHFRSSFSDEELARKRTNRVIVRYFQVKEQEEHRRHRQEQIRRLQALRANDNQAYLNLLKTTKNNRLLHLIRQTDEYMMRIGAQIERSRDLNGETKSPNPFVRATSTNQEFKGDLDEIGHRREMYFTLTHSITEEVRQPSLLVGGVLKPYQLDGLKWLVSLYNNNLNGILADEMGLGKTIQTISLITYLVEKKDNKGPFLIIVPLSTIGNWVRELNLWAPSIEKVVYRGNRLQRRSIQTSDICKGTFNVLLTTYEYTAKDRSVLGPIRWQYIIIDEGHRIKNAKSKLAMVLGVKYKSRNRLLLTGTPLQNNLSELWALLNFLLPTIFNSADTFEKWFKEPFETTTLGEGTELDEEETLLIINRLHQVLRPFLLRRLKTDVESQLPDKTEHVIQCDLSVWQVALYRQMRNKIAIAAGNSSAVRTFNNMLMQLKKICNHPYLFYDFQEVGKLPPDFIIRSSGKFLLLEHMLKKLQLAGHRTLLFSQMTRVLDYLEDFLALLHVSYLRLDGSTKSEERQSLLENFNADDSPYFCFLLSTRAGGLGLNLQSADTVIIFDSDWNPMMDLQAQDRAHRIGQTREVRVFRLISANSIEVKILERASQKLRMDAQVIQAGQFNNKATESDRRTMLKQILQSFPGAGGSNGDNGASEVPSSRELNEMLARDPDEFQMYEKFDRARKKSGKQAKPLREEELPSWVLQVEVAQPTPNSSTENLGRGQRKRPRINYSDAISEGDWIKVMQGDLSLEEAVERRRRRSESQDARRSNHRREESTRSPSCDLAKVSSRSSIEQEWEALDDSLPQFQGGSSLADDNQLVDDRALKCEGVSDMEVEAAQVAKTKQSDPPTTLMTGIRRSSRLRRSGMTRNETEVLVPRKRLKITVPTQDDTKLNVSEHGPTQKGARSNVNRTQKKFRRSGSNGRCRDKVTLRIKLPSAKEGSSAK